MIPEDETNRCEHAAKAQLRTRHPREMISSPGCADLVQGFPISQSPPNRIPEPPPFVITPATINDDHDIAHMTRNVIVPFTLVSVRNHLTRRRPRAGENRSQNMRVVSARNARTVRGERKSHHTLEIKPGTSFCRKCPCQADGSLSR